LPCQTPAGDKLSREPHGELTLVTKIVLIVGASSGIGRATALEFAAQGAAVTLVARGRPALESAAQECLRAGACSADVQVADVGDLEAVKAAVDATLAGHGRIDVVVHTATVMAYGSLEDLDESVFERVVRTAIVGSFNVARAVLPVFRRQQQGSLVFVSSLLASVTAPTMGAYVTGKWGQLGLIRVLQQETRDAAGITISAVAPGGVNTPIYYQAANVVGREGRPPPPVYSPERVARKVVRVVMRPRRLTQSGILNPAIISGFRVLPGVYDALVGPLLHVLGYSRRAVDLNDGNVFSPRAEWDETHGRWRSL
jgi:NAD(P)-dependent dehydrogenase (short-subunit alcohol dehydrogenase family)